MFSSFIPTFLLSSSVMKDMESKKKRNKKIKNEMVKKKKQTVKLWVEKRSGIQQYKRSFV